MGHPNMYAVDDILNDWYLSNKSTESQASTSDAAQINTLEADQQCDELSSVRIYIYWAKVL
jgi:hypothetical protein